MKTILAAGLALALCASPAFAEGPITIEHPWLRATPRAAPVAGGYATITNHGTEPDRLLSASLPMASDGQVHTMSMAGGVMSMRRLADGLVVPPGKSVTLAPGGDHMMFDKPTAPLKEGDSVSGSMTFAKAGKIAVTFVVGGMAAKVAPGTKAPAGHDHGAMDHGAMDHGSMDHGAMDHMH